MDAEAVHVVSDGEARLSKTTFHKHSTTISLIYPPWPKVAHT